MFVAIEKKRCFVQVRPPCAPMSPPRFARHDTAHTCYSTPSRWQTHVRPGASRSKSPEQLWVSVPVRQIFCLVLFQMARLASTTPKAATTRKGVKKATKAIYRANADGLSLYIGHGRTWHVAHPGQSSHIQRLFEMMEARQGKGYSGTFMSPEGWSEFSDAAITHGGHTLRWQSEQRLLTFNGNEVAWMRAPRNG